MKFIIIGKGADIMFFTFSDMINYLYFNGVDYKTLDDIEKWYKRIKYHNVKSWTKEYNDFNIRIERSEK